MINFAHLLCNNIHRRPQNSIQVMALCSHQHLNRTSTGSAFRRQESLEKYRTSANGVIAKVELQVLPIRINSGAFSSACLASKHTLEIIGVGQSGEANLIAIPIPCLKCSHDKLFASFRTSTTFEGKAYFTKWESTFNTQQQSKKEVETE